MKKILKRLLPPLLTDRISFLVPPNLPRQDQLRRQATKRVRKDDVGREASLTFKQTETDDVRKSALNAYLPQEPDQYPDIPEVVGTNKTAGTLMGPKTKQMNLGRSYCS
jgi:hypothetical protein